MDGDYRLYIEVVLKNGKSEKVFKEWVPLSAYALSTIEAEEMKYQIQKTLKVLERKIKYGEKGPR